MIRVAELDDLLDVYRLVCVLENIPLNYNRFKEVYRKELSKENSYFYVYVERQKIVGYISFYIKDLLHHEARTGEIVELVVDPNYRSQGIGQSLIEKVEQLAIELDLEEIELCTSLWRKDAHRFYERNGFIMNHYNYIKKMNY